MGGALGVKIIFSNLDCFLLTWQALYATFEKIIRQNCGPLLSQKTRYTTLQALGDLDYLGH